LSIKITAKEIKTLQQKQTTKKTHKPKDGQLRGVGGWWGSNKLHSKANVKETAD